MMRRGHRSKSVRAAAACFVALLTLAGCTAHYPVTEAATTPDQSAEYTVGGWDYAGRSEEILMLLTFSGGGTRAAALSYGVLEVLRDTRVSVGGEERRLLDEVDVISSVSGGSFTSAYFGLFGDRIFESYEDKFLYNDVQGELVGRLLSPASWVKLGSPYYDRSEMAADFYDELLFENMTFADFANAGGPMVVINATEASLGTQFSFMGRQFDPICTDLMSFPVSRAVTASSAVPVAFTSVVMRNHAGTCGYEQPKWVREALQNRRVSTRQYHSAKHFVAFQDTQAMPFIHLFDGGLSDNLGVRPLLNVTFAAGGFLEAIQGANVRSTNKLVVVVVNAQTDPKSNFGKRDVSVPLVDTLNVASSVPLDQYSYETLELLRSSMKEWEREIVELRCAQAKKASSAEKEETLESCQKAKTYLIEVSLEAIRDPKEREALGALPTSFRLEQGEVDRLRAAAADVLEESAEFQSLVRDLR